MSARNETESVHVSAQVDTLNEALAWVVQQVDARGMEMPNISIAPLFSYPPGLVEEEQGRWMFEVSVGGTQREAV